MQLKKKIENFLKKAKNPLIVILGPTASGKTALSLKIAHEFNGEIISTDSRQIYKGMEISTDAILPSQREKIPHHMLGITTPDKTLTLAEFKEIALKKISGIHKKGHIPILVGGTGLYISSIIEGYKVPKVPPDTKLRSKLEKEAREKGKDYVYKKLKKLDPKTATTIHPNNLRYVIRAIEINLSTGKNKIDKKSTSPFDVFIIGIYLPREILYKRVEERVNQQIERGLIQEVKKLLKKGYDENLPAMSSLGVKEIIPYIKGKMSLEDCVKILKQNTRHYAKRQMTWFRRYDSVMEPNIVRLRYPPKNGNI